MKRKERIFSYLREQSEKLKQEDLQGEPGFDAQQIAEELDFLRNNVSKDLNELNREGRIVKFGGRPVRYVERVALENLFGMTIAEPLQFQSLDDCLAKIGLDKPKPKDPFSQLIGYDRSLERQVEQGKAAILYPPDGLHTLIVGQTGVGKTLFAHLMYEYGRSMGKFGEDAPFVTFNCADYYHNPQLLLSHIFGHIKGAFTGADSARAGLVEEADGGVLFLDEIHRLPPEGQEMIFYFMDTGTYSRLGETSRSRKAKVLIIGATTEDPASALTKTFVRRIPNIVKIPPLEKRSMEEKLDLLRLLFMDEAQRVKKPIRVSVEAIKALVGSIGGGNVGQLKSNIKLLCAQAFLSSIDNPDYMEIDFRMLPPNIRSGLLTLSANRKELSEVTHLVPDTLVITPGGHRALPGEEGKKEPFNLYQMVGDKVRILKGEGIHDDLIKQIVASDVNVYVKELYNKKNSATMSTRERLLKIVDPSLVDFAEQISMLVQKRMNCGYSDRFLYAFSLHLSAFLKRAKAGEVVPYTEIEGGVSENPVYRKLAEEIAAHIAAHYHIEVPTVEMEYIALLLESVRDDALDEKVVILVTAHGGHTASDMVDVAQKLFGTADANLVAMDMPLDVSPQDTLEKMVVQLRPMHPTRGVLILADMGSLCNVGTILSERLGVPVRTLDMVSTPLILEAARKADLAGMDLDSLYESLRNFRGYESVDAAAEKSQKPLAIVTICSTGQGAAVKLEHMVEEILRHAGKAMKVLPVGLVHLEQHLDEIAQEYHIVAAVGMKKPKREIPFIPLEQLIDGSGEQILLEVLHAERSEAAGGQEYGDAVVVTLARESLDKFLTYLNPAKILKSLLAFDQTVESELGLHLSNPLRLRLIVHCGCALERVVTHSPLVYRDDKSQTDPRKIRALQKAAKVFRNALKLEFPEDEFYFMAEML